MNIKSIYEMETKVPKELHPDAELIEKMGGTYAVARICKIKPPSVSEWKTDGIPPARRMFLELKFPQVFSAQ